jgi:hypothetical protein
VHARLVSGLRGQNAAMPGLAEARASGPILRLIVPEVSPRIVAARECRLFTLVLRDDGILVYDARPGVEILRPDAEEILQVGLALSGGRSQPVLVLMQDISRIDRGARTLFASDEFLALCSRTALVVGSPVSRVIGRFLIGLNLLKFPCEIFDDADKAIAWLLR